MKFYHTALAVSIYLGDVFMKVLLVSMGLFVYFIYSKII